MKIGVFALSTSRHLRVKRARNLECASSYEPFLARFRCRVFAGFRFGMSLAGVVEGAEGGLPFGRW